MLSVPFSIRISGPVDAFETGSITLKNGNSNFQAFEDCPAQADTPPAPPHSKRMAKRIIAVLVIGLIVIGLIVIVILSLSIKYRRNRRPYVLVGGNDSHDDNGHVNDVIEAPRLSCPGSTPSHSSVRLGRERERERIIIV